MIPWWLAAVLGAGLLFVGVIVGNELRVWRRVRHGIDVDLVGAQPDRVEFDWEEPTDRVPLGPVRVEIVPDDKETK